MAVANLVKGIAFAASLFLTCFFGTLVLLLPCIPVALKLPAVGRRLMDAFLWLWFVFAAAMYELLLGVRVVVRGQAPPPGQSILILCNHRTRLDWLFLVSYQLRCGALNHYRISLKKQLKYLPGPGWAMQCAGFLFLQRDWKIDEGWITQALKYFAQMGTQPQFLLFPEGTDYCENGLVKSRKFAKANNLPMYEYVLHPRSTGFIHFINQMKHNRILDWVVDLTVAYPENIVHGELDLCRGLAPRQVHFLTRAHPVSHLPRSPDKLEAWCRDIWHQKEQRLQRFYSDNSNHPTTTTTTNTNNTNNASNATTNTTTAAIATAASGKKTFRALDGESENLVSEAVSAEKETSVRRLLWCVTVFWAAFMCGMMWALVWSPLFRWYCVLSALTFFFIGRSYGGVDHLLYATCT